MRSRGLLVASIATALASVCLTACGAVHGIPASLAPGLSAPPEGSTLTPPAEAVLSQPPVVAERLAMPLTVSWRYAMRHFDLLPYAPMESAQPVLDGNRLYTATARGRALYAFDARRGTTEWVYRTGGRVEATPGFGGGRVYAADTKGGLHAVSDVTGARLWRTDLGAITNSALLYDKDASAERVVVSTGDNRVRAFDAGTGAALWAYRRDAPADLTIYGSSSPVRLALSNGPAYVVGFSDGALVALSAANGVPVWETRLVTRGRFRDVDGTVAVSGGRLYVTAFDDGLHCLDAETGKVLWSQPPGGASGVALSADRLFHGIEAGDVLARDAGTGRELWRWHMPSGVPTTPSVDGEFVFVASSSRTLYALRADNGSLVWTFDPGTRVSGSWAAPLAAGSRVYFVTNAGIVYSFEPAAASSHYIGTWDSGTRRN